MPWDDDRFDRENVAKEIEDLGKSERNAIRSEVRRIIEHLLKLQYSPSVDPRTDWMASIVSARAELEERLSATLRRDLEVSLPRLNRNARKQAGLGLDRYAEGGAARALPEECPHTLDKIIEEDWYPAPPPAPLQEEP